jgi:hypothetical protein
MKPYYEQDGITIYVVNCDAWIPMSERVATERANVGRTSRKNNLARRSDTSKHPNTSPNALSLAQIIRIGRVMLSASVRGGRVLYGDTHTSGRVPRAESPPRNGTISTETRRITNPPTSPSFVGGATWQRMVA